MKLYSALFVAMGVLLPALVSAAAPFHAGIELRPDAPACKTPKAKPPKLGVDVANDMPTEIKADFNGDGWCDHALGVPYPLNSQMNGYDLNQLMVLGQASGWKPVFNGKKAWQLGAEGYDHQTWPTFRVDLTDIRLVFPKQGGAPFVLGLYAGGSGDGKREMGNGCQQYNSVYRWDDAVGTFKESDEATREAVLKYFYSAVEKPCSARK